jgi:alpha-L-fucosidase
MHRIRKIVFAFVICLAVCGARAAAGAQGSAYTADWASLDARPAPQWYTDARFGIFIHWGVYSAPAWAPKTTYSEWYLHDLTEGPLQGPLAKYAGKSLTPTQEFHNRVYGKDFKYEQFAPMFRAEMFDPAQWADFFARSGAKYVVLTSKHHDGYCLWPAPDSAGWNSVDAGPGRDLVGDLAAAVRAKGLRFGVYYSLYEWYNPLYHDDVGKYVDTHMLPQLKDVVTRYAPAVIFSDGEWDHPDTTWRSTEFLAWLYNQGPNPDEVVVNDRWGKDTRSAHGGYYTSEYGAGRAGRQMDKSRPWEENQGMGRSFGYNRNEDITNYKSAAELIHMLIDIVSQGGNLLLDIGPTADGRIPVIMQERLLQMGEWLSVNGEAIYGAHPWRAQADGESVRYTAKGHAVYAIVKSWPGRELVLAEPRAGAGTSISLLGSDAKIDFKTQNGALTIAVPALDIPHMSCRHAWVFKLTGVE